MMGIGIILGIPGLAYILLFYKEQRKRSVPLADTARLISLARDLSDLDTSRLLKSAHKLVMKLERASQDSMQAQTKSLETLPKNLFAAVDGNRRMRSFSEFVS